MMARKSVWTVPQGEEGEGRTSAPGDDKTTHFGFRVIPEKEKVTWVRNHFDTVAEKYDMMNTLLSFGIHYLWKRTAIKLLGLKESDVVLDICGGTGDLSLLAVKQVSPSGKVVLYDINRAMMEAGRGKATHAKERKAILYVQGNAELISFKSESFDAAMIGFGIRNLTHMDEGLREIHRVLKPHGRFVCLEFSKPTTPWFRWLYDFYSFHIMPILGSLCVGSRQAYTYLPESIRVFPSPGELSRLMEEIGFCQVTYRALTNGIAAVHLGRKEKPQHIL
jgi:demethylmenaquinone methyltransferase/2-methoxy-6-polyprenyl-1,4-benzoquinol methylase